MFHYTKRKKFYILLSLLEAYDWKNEQATAESTSSLKASSWKLVNAELKQKVQC